MVKKILATVLAVVMMMGFGTSVLAADSTFSHNKEVVVNDIITNSGWQEIVIKVNEDGSFVTSKLDLLARINPNECNHNSLLAYGPSYGTSQSYNGDNATNCYKTRTYQNAHCGMCGKTGFKIYTSWKNVAHSYPLFGKTCKECSYTK